MNVPEYGALAFVYRRVPELSRLSIVKLTSTDAGISLSIVKLVIKLVRRRGLCCSVSLP
ncbi:hypothetical protein JS533_009980 [Bifidobacterium amazonense]|uniref:Uncharacterized protein n=1 Tax=Bifidobacterium amazonense TaxID=2809027 RepID=A0ABS9VXE3_9BIFI|nr:hypothetical protein [Bifidobacterium amazonense]MCH9276591.1 hypothetical protein [Bifidobacterium amazonense]